MFKSASSGSWIRTSNSFSMINFSLVDSNSNSVSENSTVLIVGNTTSNSNSGWLSEDSKTNPLSEYAIRTSVVDSNSDSISEDSRANPVLK